MSELAAGQPLDTWAIVELFGHKKLAGKVSEHTIGGAALVRVDVPETDQGGVFTKPYTKLVGTGSIYCITPCTEGVARAAAQRIERYNDPIPVDIRPVPQIPARSTADADFELSSEDDEHDDDPDGNDPPEAWQR